MIILKALLEHMHAMKVTGVYCASQEAVKHIELPNAAGKGRDMRRRAKLAAARSLASFV